MPSGGYRKPTNPAPASGPGRLSKRTDGAPGQKLMAPTGMPYGAHEDMVNQERAAPLSQQPNSPVTPDGVVGHTREFSGTGFGEPTTMPDVPITDGVDIGPGAGSEALSFQTGQAARPTGAMTQILQKFAATDGSGLMAKLLQQAAAKGV